MSRGVSREVVEGITGRPKLVAGDFPGPIIDIGLPFLAEGLEGLLFDWVGGVKKVGVVGGRTVELVEGPLEVEGHNIRDEPGDALCVEDDL